MYRRHKRRKSTSWFIVIIAAAGITWLLWPNNETVGSSEERPIVITSVPEVIATPPPIVNEKPKPVLPVKPVIKEPVEITKVEKPVEIIPPVVTTPIPLVATTSTNLDEGLDLLDRGQFVEARASLSTALRSGTLSDVESAQARGVLTDISDKLVFSPEINSTDPFSLEYIIKGGDTLSGIVQKMGLQVNWRFIQRINNIKQATSIRPGQSVKLVTGPFNAIVNKDTYRIDLYLGDGNEQVFVRSYRVGLGEFNSTPVGLFRVRENSKLINPTWHNPRTREFFSADNPDNPIGERWIGLQGIEEQTKDLSGLGIHGTIEPNSIGTQSSMGCIRMLGGDVAQVYEMLSEGVSTVEIK
jgi:lipoprotein-anchoring transpeptidase ErfK/SrfK